MTSMKGLFWGILLIILVGIGGFVYRNALEHPSQPIACPIDHKTCPDGTTVARTGLSCTFPACPAPNVSLETAGIAFAIPVGFTESSPTDANAVAAYESTGSASTTSERIEIRQFAIQASSTALEVIQQTAIGSASGAPVSITSFSSTTIGDHRFSVVTVGRFEGIVDTAYYLAQDNKVTRFDAIDSGVTSWTDSNLDIDTLPAHAALITMLGTLQVL